MEKNKKIHQAKQSLFAQFFQFFLMIAMLIVGGGITLVLLYFAIPMMVVVAAGYRELFIAPLIFIGLAFISGFMTWRIIRKRYTAWKIRREENIRIDHLMERHESEIEIIEQDYFHEEQQDSL
jgi:membrane protein implicated in regulation of membrane protease activity